MPTLQLDYATPRPAPAHAALADALTSLTAQRLGKRHDLTQVQIRRVPVADWFVGAVAAADSGLAGYRLSIDVSEGTNTPEEMAAYIAATHQALAGLLGPVAPASYVLLQTQPMAQWGWSGRTQADRAADGPATQLQSTPAVT
jgi:4-oxalocrotonate tautomerase